MNIGLKAFFAVAIFAASSVASAQWYGGVTYGSSKASLPDPVRGANGFVFSIDKDERDTAYKLQAGYRIHRNFAVEGGYVNLGKFNATASLLDPERSSLRSDFKADGWNLVAVGILPLIQDFAVYGKAGTIYATSTSTQRFSGNLFPAPGSNLTHKHSEFDWTYGLGLQYDVNKNVAVRGEWERFDRLRSSTTGSDHDTDTYSIGLIYKF